MRCVPPATHRLSAMRTHGHRSATDADGGRTFPQEFALLDRGHPSPSAFHVVHALDVLPKGRWHVQVVSRRGREQGRRGCTETYMGHGKGGTPTATCTEKQVQNGHAQKHWPKRARTRARTQTHTRWEPQKQVRKHKKSGWRKEKAPQELQGSPERLSVCWNWMECNGVLVCKSADPLSAALPRPKSLLEEPVSYLPPIFNGVIHC